MSDSAPARIDLPADVSRQLETHAKAIDKARNKGIAAMLDLGRALVAARTVLANHGNGVFGKWIEERCCISRMSACRYINTYEALDGKDCNSLLQTSSAEALYFLTRDTTPETAIDEAIEAAQSGERITLKKAKEIVADSLPKVEAEPEPDAELEDADYYTPTDHDEEPPSSFVDEPDEVGDLFARLMVAVKEHEPTVRAVEEAWGVWRGRESE